MIALFCKGDRMVALPTKILPSHSNALLRLSKAGRKSRRFRNTTGIKKTSVANFWIWLKNQTNFDLEILRKLKSNLFLL